MHNASAAAGYTLDKHQDTDSLEREERPFRLLPLGGTHRGDAVCRQRLWLLPRAGFLSTREMRWPPSFDEFVSGLPNQKLKFHDQKNPWSSPGNEGSWGLRASGSHLGPAPVRAAGLRVCTPENSLFSRLIPEPSQQGGRTTRREDSATPVSERGLKSVE